VRVPYFKWIGVTLIGETKKGKLAAHSPHELSERLLLQGIAVLDCKVVYASTVLWSIRSGLKGQIFNRIAQLLSAGIMLPDALTISAQQSCHPVLYDSLFNCAIDIKNGISFASALEKQHQLCDQIATTMLLAGYESGDVTAAFNNVARYYKMQDQFKKEVRSALAMPFITLLFFVGITVFIFVFIMPRFADMFSSLHHDLPFLTRHMVAISIFMRSWSMIGLMVSFGVMLFAVSCYCKTRGKSMVDALCARMPFVGKLIYYHQLGQGLHALSLLVNSGVSLSYALKMVSASVTNSVVKKCLVFLYDEIQLGRLLSHAMFSAAIFLPEVVAVVRVGEESGELGASLDCAAQLYKDVLQQMLGRFVFFLQPIMIIILGLLITALILSVYLPVMELSHAM
jgi:type IV pilus assembly protein PilC